MIRMLRVHYATIPQAQRPEHPTSRAMPYPAPIFRGLRQRVAVTTVEHGRTLR